jgi:hypothetical protein
MNETPRQEPIDRREFFSRRDIEDLIRRDLPIYTPAAVVEWQSDGSAVVIWSDVSGPRPPADMR